MIQLITEDEKIIDINKLSYNSKRALPGFVANIIKDMHTDINVYSDDSTNEKYVEIHIIILFLFPVKLIINNYARSIKAIEISETSNHSNILGDAITEDIRRVTDRRYHENSYKHDDIDQDDIFSDAMVKLINTEHLNKELNKVYTISLSTYSNIDKYKKVIDKLYAISRKNGPVLLAIEYKLIYLFYNGYQFQVAEPILHANDINSFSKDNIVNLKLSIYAATLFDSNGNEISYTTINNMIQQTIMRYKSDYDKEIKSKENDVSKFIFRGNVANLDDPSINDLPEGSVVQNRDERLYVKLSGVLLPLKTEYKYTDIESDIKNKDDTSDSIVTLLE